MNDKTERSKLPRHPRIWWSRTKTKWPFLIWIGAVILSFYFYSVGVDLAAFVGHIEAIDLPVSPAEDSRVEKVMVMLGDQVTNGQLIAQMESSLIAAEIAINEALAQESTASATDSILSLYGGYRKALTDAESQLNGELIALGEAQGELQATTNELARLRKLIAEGVMTADSSGISRLITQEASLRESVRLYPESVRSIQERISKAAAEYQSFRKWLGIEAGTEVTEALVEKIRQNVSSPVQQIALLQQRMASYTLRAPAAGTIAHLYERPGNVVARGIPVVTVLVASQRVVGFLPEIFAKEPTTGQLAMIIRRSGDDRSPIPAVVEVMSPRIEPTTVTGPTGQTMRGRRIYLRMTAKTDVLPGETVDIQLVARSNPWLHSLKEIGRSMRSIVRKSPTEVDKVK